MESANAQGIETLSQWSAEFRCVLTQARIAYGNRQLGDEDFLLRVSIAFRKHGRALVRNHYAGMYVPVRVLVELEYARRWLESLIPPKTGAWRPIAAA